MFSCQHFLQRIDSSSARPSDFKEREAYSFQVRDNQIEYYTAPEVQAADNKSQTQYPDRCCLGLINFCSHSGVAILQHGQHSSLAPSQMDFHVAGTGSEEHPANNTIKSLPFEEEEIKP